MDINETLRRIRELRALASVTKFKEDHFIFTTEIVELFDALDENLSKGGFLPNDWRRATKG